MKKEIFETEITILRDTFRRLIRRHAKTNIIKLIDKTHPADMALTFQYLNEAEQDLIFNFMKANNNTVEFLSELYESTALRLLENDSADRIASILKYASSNEQAYLMGLVNERFANSVIKLLETDEQEQLEEIMAYPDDSAGSLMNTDVFTLHEETNAKQAVNATIPNNIIIG